MIIIIINNKIIINKLNRGQNSDDFRHLSLFFKHINVLETLNSDFNYWHLLLPFFHFSAYLNTLYGHETITTLESIKF